jgi:hypothetical protein
MKKKASARKPKRGKKTTASLAPRQTSRVKGGAPIMEKYDATAKNIIQSIGR